MFSGWAKRSWTDMKKKSEGFQTLLQRIIAVQEPFPLLCTTLQSSFLVFRCKTISLIYLYLNYWETMKMPSIVLYLAWYLKVWRWLELESLDLFTKTLPGDFLPSLPDKFLQQDIWLKIKVSQNCSFVTLCISFVFV